MTEASNKDIYQAVMDAVKAHENLKKNGEDDVDDDGPIKPCPSRQDVLKAVSTIVQYVSELNNSLACKIEALLGSLVWLIRKDEARSMKNTVLTDFFQRS